MKRSSTQKASQRETSKSSTRIPLKFGKETIYEVDLKKAMIWVGMELPYPGGKNMYKIEKISNDFVTLSKSFLNYSPEVYTCINCKTLIHIDYYDIMCMVITELVKKYSIESDEYLILEAFISMEWDKNLSSFVCEECLNKMLIEKDKCLAKSLKII